MKIKLKTVSLINKTKMHVLRDKFNQRGEKACTLKTISLW